MIRAYRPVASAAGLILIASVAACSTPKSVQNLAKKTSDNAVGLAISLDKFQKASAADAERRATNIARLSSSIAEARLLHEQEIALAQKAGRSKPVGLYNDIRGLADTWARKEAEAKQAGTAKRQAVLEAQEKLETEAAKFRTLGTQLLELSKADSGESQVTFLIGFVKDVASNLRDAEKAAAAQQENPEETNKPKTTGQ